MTALIYDGIAIRLRTVAASDYAILHAWRCGGQPHYMTCEPSTTVFANFSRWLDGLRSHNIVLLIVDKKTGKPAGYLLTYQTNMWDGWAYWAVYISPKFRMTRHLVEAGAAASELLFSQFPFRKLYVEVYEFAERLLRPLSLFGFVEEGYTPAHALVGGRPIGVWTWALYRETWQGRARIRSRFLMAGEKSSPHY